MNPIGILIVLTLLVISDQDSHDQIISKVDNRLQPIFLSANVKLSYNNSIGEKIEERHLYYRRKWNNIESESVLIKFISPEEIKNSAFLAITENEKSRQSFFLPEIGITKEIKNSKLNSSFMNSDFHFGDLKSWKLSDNKNKLLNETEKYYIIESLFQKAWFKHRIVIRIDKRSFFIDQIKYFNNTFICSRHVKRINKHPYVSLREEYFL